MTTISQTQSPFSGAIYTGFINSNGNTESNMLVSVYYATNAFTGASVGDIILGIDVYALGDTSTPPMLTTTLWQNKTTGQMLSGTPSISSLKLAVNQTTSPYAFYTTAQVDEATPGTTYIRKSGPSATDGWLIQRVVESGTSTTLTHAGIGNNPSTTVAGDAWAARATLVYGELSQA